MKCTKRYFSKREFICYHCNKPILKGQEVISSIRGARKAKQRHSECYVDAKGEIINV